MSLFVYLPLYREERSPRLHPDGGFDILTGPVLSLSYGLTRCPAGCVNITMRFFTHFISPLFIVPLYNIGW